MQIITLIALSLLVYPSHIVSSDLISNCNWHSESTVVKLLLNSVDLGGIIIDIGGFSSENLPLLVEAVGVTGFVVVIQRNMTIVEEMQLKYPRNLFENTVILSDNTNGSYNMADIAGICNHVCPQLVFVYNNDSLLLHGSNFLIKCRPLFYVSNEYIETSSSIINMFLFAGYRLYWHYSFTWSHDLPKLSLNLNHLRSPYRIYMVAVPLEKDEVFGVGSLLQSEACVAKYEFGKDLLEQYSLALLVKIASKDGKYQIDNISIGQTHIKQPDDNGSLVTFFVVPDQEQELGQGGTSSMWHVYLPSLCNGSEYVKSRERDLSMLGHEVIASSTGSTGEDTGAPFIPVYHCIPVVQKTLLARITPHVESDGVTTLIQDEQAHEQAHAHGQSHALPLSEVTNHLNQMLQSVDVREMALQIDLRDVMAPNDSPDTSCYRSYCSLGSQSQNCCSYPAEISLPTEMHHEALHSVLVGFCQHHVTLYRSRSGEGEDSLKMGDDSVLEGTKVNLVRGCVEFLKARYEFKRGLIPPHTTRDKRTISFRQEEYRSSHPNSMQQAVKLCVKENLTCIIASRQHFFNPHFEGGGHRPFALDYQLDYCGEPIWCDHLAVFQSRIAMWQNPNSIVPNRFNYNDNNLYNYFGHKHNFNRETAVDAKAQDNCSTKKFLVYQVQSNVHGIGSMLSQLALMFRLAMCLDRILFLDFRYLPHTTTRWMHPGCRGSFFECYFEPLTECSLTNEEIDNAMQPYKGENPALESYPLKYHRIIRITGVVSGGICNVCGSQWEGSKRLLEGLHIGERGFTTRATADGYLDTTVFEPIDYDVRTMSHFSATLTMTKIFWMSQFTRYLIKPRKWFEETLLEAIQATMNSPVIPHPYASIHVRYGEKVIETESMPLQTYINYLVYKAPHIKHVFVSTETSEVITNLTRDYPEYTFHYLSYDRHEFIHTNRKDKNMPSSEDPSTPDTSHIDFPKDFIMSFANLYIATNADFYVGTLSSSWCVLINMLQRTRGDGGEDYHSVDKGSSYSTCF